MRQGPGSPCGVGQRQARDETSRAQLTLHAFGQASFISEEMGTAGDVEEQRLGCLGFFDGDKGGIPMTPPSEGP
jgi:hypothetical protein